MGPRNDLRAKAPVIAMDGPGASGKTTVGLGLAKRLGYRFIDTGVMYRAATLLALKRGVSLDDEAELSRIAGELSIRIGEQPAADAPPKVFVDGQDFSSILYTPEVDRAVSRVSEVAGVRRALVDLQRQMAREAGVVMVGRDVGTQVLPDAALKVFLDASAEVRAKRRYRELHERGEPIAYETVLEDLRRRDRLDSQRAISPLVPAADARRIDTDNSTVDEAIEAICHLLREL